MKFMALSLKDFGKVVTMSSVLLLFAPSLIRSAFSIGIGDEFSAILLLSDGRVLRKSGISKMTTALSKNTMPLYIKTVP